MSFQVLLLDPREQGEYVELRERVRKMMAQEHGLELLLNAIVATGDENTRVRIDRWTEASYRCSRVDRDVSAFCHGPERLVSLPPLLLPFDDEF